MSCNDKFSSHTVAANVTRAKRNKSNVRLLYMLRNEETQEIVDLIDIH